MYDIGVTNSLKYLYPSPCVFQHKGSQIKSCHHKIIGTSLKTDKTSFMEESLPETAKSVITAVDQQILEKNETTVLEQLISGNNDHGCNLHNEYILFHIWSLMTNKIVNSYSCNNHSNIEHCLLVPKSFLLVNFNVFVSFFSIFY